ncbi:hypothetical protein SETIT_4G136200v2, partial [Setaria italica]
RRRRPRHSPHLPLRHGRVGSEGSELPLHVRPALDVVVPRRDRPRRQALETYPVVGHTAEDVVSRRMVRVSQGKVRFVEVARGRAHRQEETLVVVWTLVFGPSGFTFWKQQSATSLGRIWASDSYRATGLSATVPVLALLHPSNPDVVYFFLEKYLEMYLFGVSVSRSTVVHFVHNPFDLVKVVSGHRRPPPISWRHVLAWELPASLANGKANASNDQLKHG